MNKISSIIKSKYFSWVLILLFFSLSNFPMLINGGVFWDDWIIYNQNPSTVLTAFTEIGFPPSGHFHNFLNLSLAPAITYHVLTFLVYLSIPILLILIAKKIPSKNRFNLFYIIFIAAVIPYNGARTTMITLPYAISYFLFFLGTYFLMLYINSNNVFYRIITLSIFFMSFLTNSLMFFFIIPLAYLIYSNCTLSKEQLLSKKNLNKILHSSLKHLDFIILPILFFIIKSTFYAPVGLAKHVSYNTISSSGLINSLPLMTQSFQQSFLGLFAQVFELFLSGYIYLILSFILSITLYFTLPKVNKNNSSKMMLILGVIFFLIGCFPYTLVGKVASFHGYDTRHQLLLPIGASLIITGLIQFFIKNKKVGKLAFSIIISLFTLLGLNQQLNYLKGSFKQISLINEFRKNEIIRNNSTFLIIDNTKHLNETEETYAFYVWNGLMKYSFGNETRFAIGNRSYRNVLKRYGLKLLLTKKDKFNASQYELSDFDYFIKINEGEYKMGTTGIVKLLLHRFISKKKFQQNLNKILNIEVKKYDQESHDFFISNS